MAEGGAGLSSRASTAERAPAPRKNPAPPAHWGSALRTILTAPRKGFTRALRLSRDDDGGRAGSILVLLLSGLGGAYLLLMFLKIRGLVGFREVSPEDTQWWGGLGLAVVAAVVAGIIGHFLFGLAAPPLVARVGKRCKPRDLRTIWGLSSFPAAVGFTLLVILDLVIAGREAYSSLEGSSLTTGWAAGSLAIGLSLGAWSLYLFLQGLQVAADVRPSRSIMVLLVAVLCLMPATFLGIIAVVGVASLVGMLVNVVQAVNK